MNETVVVNNSIKLGFNFIAKDEYKFRNLEAGDDSAFRNLTESEIETLRDNGCVADDWKNILVKDGFLATHVSRVRFFGKNRIGSMTEGFIQFHDYVQPCGITDTTMVSCDIGNFCAIHKVSYLSHYIIRDYVMLSNIFEMQTTNHSKFGNGIVKEDEDPSVRIDLSVLNENLGRRIAPFEDLLCADAFLWADNPSDKKLSDALWNLTDKSYSLECGWYGEVGRSSVIKNCQIIKDVKTGSGCYIKGCSKLKNLTVKSSLENPTQLGEGCELVNGIIGYGCKVFYGCKAVRFVLEENSTLKYGARLLNSVLGENSTVSCCEVLNNLIFPFHEQHHNNSFLISSLVMGQSNMAAGANIGSNHNSRSADGELRVGRGFWPALSSSIKFDSKFVSFILIAKGNYNYELNIQTPFSLLTDNTAEGRRELLPGYWWLYNMYALERNVSKFEKRDKRYYKEQYVETDYLAPDTASEIIQAMDLLCKWTAASIGVDESEAKNILCNNPEKLGGKEVFALNQENSKKKIKILKPSQGYKAYKEMLLYYGIKETVKYCAKNNIPFNELEKELGNAVSDWTNLGGQLVPSYKVEQLKDNIKKNKFGTWKEVHSVYERWKTEYSREKALNALKTLHSVLEVESIDQALFRQLIEKLKEIRNYIDNQVWVTREKDYKNPFRMITFKSEEERDAVRGKMSDDSEVKQSLETTEYYSSLLEDVTY